MQQCSNVFYVALMCKAGYYRNGEDGVLIKVLLLQACTDCIVHKGLYEQEAFFIVSF